jgi:uncharacterized Zn-binding protein involved in type VI secretion
MQQALLGDRITCPNTPICPHPKRGPYTIIGVIKSCKVSTVLVSGRPPATVGDLAFCGGPSFLTTGCLTVLIQNMPAHRVGDRNHCTGHTLGSGAPTVLVG